MGIFDLACRLLRLAANTTVEREPTLRVRWAEMGDVCDVWDLLHEAGAGIFVGKSPNELANCMAFGRQIARSGVDLPMFGAAVATWRDEVIGAACCVQSSDAVQLLWVGVAPSRRRLGVGRELLRFVAQAAEPGVKPLVALVPEDLVAACNFFKGCGWQVDRRRPLIPAQFESADQAVVFVDRNSCEDLIRVRIA